MGIILLIGIIALVYIAYNNYQTESSVRTPFSGVSSSLEIAKTRYAKDGISRDVYEQLKTDLGY